MAHVYPRAPDPVPVLPDLDDVAMATEAIRVREADPMVTFEMAVGRLLREGGGTPRDAERVWREVEAERVLWRSVSPADHSTVTKFKAALVGRHLSATEWYNGLKAEHDVTTYGELVGAVTPEVIEIP